MLEVFVVTRAFHKLRVRLYVDCNQTDSELTVSYDRIIVRLENVPFHEVRTPELAEAWLSRPDGERGNFIEQLEWACRTGVLRKAA